MEGRGLRADRLADLSRSFTLLCVDRCFSTRAGVWKRTPPLACVRFLVAQMLCHCGQLPPVAVAEGQFSVVFQFSMLKWFQEQGVWGDEIVFFGHSIPSSLKRLPKIPHFLKCNPSPDFGAAYRNASGGAAPARFFRCSRKASRPQPAPLSNHLRKLALPFPE